MLPRGDDRILLRRSGRLLLRRSDMVLLRGGDHLIKAFERVERGEDLRPARRPHRRMLDPEGVNRLMRRLSAQINALYAKDAGIVMAPSAVIIITS